MKINTNILFQDIAVFAHLSIEDVINIFGNIRLLNVDQDQTIIHQGEEGDHYYVIERGHAEVWRTDPFTDETERVAEIGPGEAFGEEAILQNGFRNATIRMMEPGRLLCLNKDAFDRIIKPKLVKQVEPSRVMEMLDSDAVGLLDCRYEMEYEESRIPGARLIPLHCIREQAYKLNPNKSYIVYCRSGRRSQAAAFLLRDYGITAISLIGGILAWPFEAEI